MAELMNAHEQKLYENLMEHNSAYYGYELSKGEIKTILQAFTELKKYRATTEAEIRAKAIDEFAEKLKESLMKNYRHFITTDTDGFDWLTTDAVGTHIEEIAEQLKEE